MNKAYVLVRKVSAYTDADLLLGVFSTLQAAELAANLYCEAVIGSDSDPLKEQAYHSVSYEDVTILSDVPIVSALTKFTENVWVVSSYAEAFGQTCRDFVGVSQRELEANALAESIEAKSEEEFPAYCIVDSIPMDQLQYPETGIPGFAE